MRKLLPAVLLWSTVISMGGPAFAQITLVPGQAFVVPRRPTYIISADFNSDNLADAAVLNLGSNKVTVLFGSASGTFGTLSDYDVARGLQNLAPGDVSNDGRPDISVVTSLEGGTVFGLFSDVNSTFLKSQRLAEVSGRRPTFLAVADLDRANGNDFVTADRTSDTVSIILNRGGNLGFLPSFTKQAGGRPISVAVADVDQDGNRDILTLNTQSSGADSVAVLRATGTGDFRAPIPFTVGEGAKTMVVTDVNRDDAPDVLVLNSAATAGANVFTVSVLLNNKPVPGTADPIFTTMSPVSVACPSTIGGIPIACAPTSLVSADFDQDGFADFVVSAQTAALSGQAVTAGLLLAYGGNGDGTFNFATQASVGVRPRDQAVGDYNGDLVPDIAVAEELDRSVRIVLSLPPVKRDPGDPCNLGTQCASTYCVDGACCSVSQCPSGQSCNIPGSEGTCVVPLDNGLACTAGNQCKSGNCVDGFCCGARSCPIGQFCNTGSCGGPAPDGSHCNSGDQCASASCVDGTCCASERCAFGERCDVPTSPGICTGPQPIGGPCTSPSQCESTFCVNGACCGVSSCPDGQSCGIPGQSGACSILPTATITPTATATPTSTPTPQPLGATCTAGSQCVSGACVDGVCCAPSGHPARVRRAAHPDPDAHGEPDADGDAAGQRAVLHRGQRLPVDLLHRRVLLRIARLPRGPGLQHRRPRGHLQRPQAERRAELQPGREQPVCGRTLLQPGQRLLSERDLPRGTAL